jgi:hypothetical protein
MRLKLPSSTQYGQRTGSGPRMVVDETTGMLREDEKPHRVAEICVDVKSPCRDRAADALHYALSPLFVIRTPGHQVPSCNTRVQDNSARLTRAGTKRSPRLDTPRAQSLRRQAESPGINYPHFGHGVLSAAFNGSTVNLLLLRRPQPRIAIVPLNQFPPFTSFSVM